MLTVAPAISWTLLLLSAGLLAYWSMALVHVARTMRRVPTARAGLALARQHPPTDSVTVIVPAHNEADAIGRLIESLKGQDYPALRVVLALDRCTDGTEEAARRAIDERFEVVRIERAEPGWAGKVYAAWRGYQCSEHARASDLVLFADADTTFDRSCISAAVALLHERELDLLSLLSTLRHRRWYEWLVQPAASLDLVHQYPLLRVNRRDRAMAFANGQFMLLRRRSYVRVGGHLSVRDELLEDIGLARQIVEHGGRAGVLLADGLLRCAMYETFGRFISGWKRIFSEAARRRPRRLVKGAGRLIVVGTVLPMAAVACMVLADAGGGPPRPVVLVIAGAGLVIWLVTLGACYRFSRAPLWAVPGHVVGGAIVSAILLRAAWDLIRGAPTRWAGLSYARSLKKGTGHRAGEGTGH
jgi:chlorobactene glucosyltransferase